MKYYLQRDTCDITARYSVADDCGRLCYTVTGRRRAPADSMRFCDQSGATVCKIRGLNLFAASVYSVSAGGECMRLNIAAANGRAAVRFHGISFFVSGDVLSGSYSILDADTAVVCTVGRDYAKGCIQLDISQKERAMFCLAAAVCIDSLNVGTIPAMQMT